MKLPVTQAAADSDTLWRRYADLLYDRALARGEPAEGAGDRRVLTSTTNWVFLTEGSAASTEKALLCRVSDQKPTILLRPPHSLTEATRINPPSQVTCTSIRLFRLQRATTVEPRSACAVLPGRAARHAYHTLCDERLAECGQLWDVDAAAHLDDAQFDPLVVLQSGVAVAMAGLQSRGQSGALFDLYVRPDLRGRGLGQLLINRVLELAARSQHVDCFAGSPVGDPVCAMLERRGFVAVADYELWAIAAGPANASQTLR